MKKFLIIISLFLLNGNFVFANKSVNLGKNLPNNFKQNCYETKGKINLNDIYKNNNLLGYQVFKVQTNKRIDTFLDSNQIIPWKIFKNSGENINFQIKNLEGNIEYLKDNNYKTYLELDTLKNNEIIIENIETNMKKFIFQYSSTNYYPEFFISQNGKDFTKINKKNIGDYDFLKLKIIFKNYNKQKTAEKIKISELNFISKYNIYLVKSLIGGFTAYSNNLCKDNYPNLRNNIGEFSINKNTKTLTLNLEKNTKLNPNEIEDKDGDGVENKIDNCPSIYNPMQKDKNGDGRGDLCNDDDRDGIIGHKDNCIYIYNPNQKDINRNGVGDKCEFDKDKDSIFDKLDNCINTSNPDQKDSDNDGIGDVCDNCNLYNPRQLDKNNNGVGDVCEEHEKYILEHDKDSDKIIDSEDNCPSISNPNQEDFDKDGIGDVCDNCKDIQNSDQLDKNKNGVGDICEDSDGDGIMGIEDNCINIANPDQKDSDNDGIGDVCEDDDGDNIPAGNDNCPFDYNPKQVDTDKDGIGDICDKKDDRFIESNKSLFIGLLVLITLIFGFAIFRMIKKLK